MKNTDPIKLVSAICLDEWLDFNGHMNVTYYTKVFDMAMDAFLEKMDVGRSYVKSGKGSVFALQNHTHYMNEVKSGETLTVTLQMLDMDEKRLHLFLRMHNSSDRVVATSELLAIHVSLPDRKSAPFPQPQYENLANLLEDHKSINRPRIAGHKIGTKSKP